MSRYLNLESTLKIAVPTIKMVDGQPVESKHGFNLRGRPRKRAMRDDSPLFLRQARDVPDDDPDHLEWQRIIRERCEEIQLSWSKTEERKRRVSQIQPIEMS